MAGPGAVGAAPGSGDVVVVDEEVGDGVRGECAPGKVVVGVVVVVVVVVGAGPGAVGAAPGMRSRGGVGEGSVLLGGVPPGVVRAVCACSTRALVPVSSRITEWWTRRSIAAAVVIGSLKIRSHSLNTRLLVIITVRRS